MLATPTIPVFSSYNFIGKDVVYVCRFLQEKSHGVPSWCAQMLKEMFYDGIIKTQLLSASTSESMVAPPACYMSRRRRTSSAVQREFGHPSAVVRVIDPYYSQFLSLIKLHSLC